jgi:hypothetical protein
MYDDLIVNVLSFGQLSTGAIKAPPVSEFEDRDSRPDNRTRR